MPPCKHRTANRRPPLRQMTSSSLSQEDLTNASKLMIERADSMGSRAKERSPLTSDELKDIINSLHNITPQDANIDWRALEQLLMDIAHLSHKDWHVTGSNSNKMAEILLPTSQGGLSTSSTAQQMFERILHEGNWDGAVAHAKSVQEKMSNEENDCINANPWAVLVTGVNGIRKTTSIYQPWFSKVLKEALVPPTTMSSMTSTSSEIPLDMLPNGDNSFFRQLDHMITTLCNEDFAILYALTCAQLDLDNGTATTTSNPPPKELISKYSNLKASIFSRYRTLSELLGVLLLKEAQSVNINAMCETSGRDVAMFHYIDHFFPSRYNKLALHFTINDLSHAKKSVDERMVREMMLGRDALESGDVVQVIYSNQGGPYGSEVLEGVQADSDRVWNEIVMADGSEANNAVGKDWYKATMQINAYSDKPWSIQAVKADGSLGTEYVFGEPRAVS